MKPSIFELIQIDVRCFSLTPNSLNTLYLHKSRVKYKQVNVNSSQCRATKMILCKKTNSNKSPIKMQHPNSDPVTKSTSSLQLNPHLDHSLTKKHSPKIKLTISLLSTHQKTKLTNPRIEPRAIKLPFLHSLVEKKTRPSQRVCVRAPLRARLADGTGHHRSAIYPVPLATVVVVKMPRVTGIPDETQGAAASWRLNLNTQVTNEVSEDFAARRRGSQVAASG